MIGCSQMSVSITDAPMRKPLLPSLVIWVSSARRITEMTVFGIGWRRFIFGYRSVPPATNCPSGPASPIILTASAIVCGVRYSNFGNRIITILMLSYGEPAKMTFENGPEPCVLALLVVWLLLQ